MNDMLAPHGGDDGVEVRLTAMLPPGMRTAGSAAAPRLALGLTAGMLVVGLGIEILRFHTVLAAGLPLGVLLVYGLARHR